MTTIKTRLLTASLLLAVFAMGYGANELIGLPELSTSVMGQSDRDAPGGPRCSARTLKGSYGIKFEGQKIDTGPFVSVSRITFDGNGSFTTTEIGRFNGNLINRTFTGPYTVADDCTGFLDFSSTISVPPHEAHGNFVIVDEGREFYVVDNEAGWAANGVGRRQ